MKKKNIITALITFVKKHHILFFLFLILFIIIKVNLALYGNPYSLHPDEIVVLKRPFKLIYSFLNLDFGSATNLYYWIASLWYGFVYVVGYLFSVWGSFQEFQELLILEDFKLIFAGRLLNVFLSTIAVIFIYKHSEKLKLPKNHLWFFMPLIFFNPFEITSSLWLKLDAMCYLMNWLLIYFSFVTYVLKCKDQKNKLIIIIFLAISLRIEFLVYLISFFIIELVQSKNLKQYFLFLYQYKRSFLIGVFIYLIITLIPLKFLIGGKETLGASEVSVPYINAITARLFEINDILPVIYRNFSKYVFDFFLLVLGPVVFFFSLKKLFEKEFIFFLILLCVWFPLLLVFPVAAARYSVGIVSILLLISFIKISEIKNRKTKKYLLSFNVIYIVSAGLFTIYSILFIPDPRIKSKEYLLSTTNFQDTLAIQSYVFPGAHPPIYQCPGVLIEKSIATRENNIGTGLTFESKALKIINKGYDCRIIIGIQEFDVFHGTPYESIFSINYDTLLIQRWKFEKIVTNTKMPMQSQKPFSLYMANNYKLEKSFEANIFDYRLHRILGSFLRPIYVYSRKPNHL